MSRWIVAAAVAFVASTSTASAPPGLTGPTWTLYTLNGLAISRDRPPTVAFAKDQGSGVNGAALSGYSGCNRYFGTYSLAPGNKIAIHIRGATKMACDPPRMAMEQSFLANMNAVASYDLLNDGAVRLLSDDGKAQLEFRQEPETSPD